MLCKYCKSNTIVADSVNNKDTDETYKLRVCTKCGHGFFTVEFPVEIDARLKKDWAKHHKYHKKIYEYSGHTFYTHDGIKKLLNTMYGVKNSKK